MDPHKVDSILSWPTPTCVKDVQSFIGLANYRRFISEFAKIAHPLHKLLKKNVKFVWTSEAQSSFDCLKSKFVSATVLIHPNRELPFIVETDSSNYAIGAVLSQVSPVDNLDHPVAFFSRSLTGAVTIWYHYNLATVTHWYLTCATILDVISSNPTLIFLFY